jgi:hypothetical protein
MAYMTAFAPCIGCKRPFAFNPDLVPSIRVNGEREPICRNCVEIANPKRIANGLEPIRVLPGAYDGQEVS